MVTQISKTRRFSDEDLLAWLEINRPSCRRCFGPLDPEEFDSIKDTDGYLYESDTERSKIFWICQCGFENTLERMGLPIEGEEEDRYQGAKSFNIAKTSGILALFTFIFQFRLNLFSEFERKCDYMVNLARAIEVDQVFPEFTLFDFADQLGLTPKVAQFDLAKLIRHHIIQESNQDGNGVYRLNDELEIVKKFKEIWFG